jgi:hypothetical protein
MNSSRQRPRRIAGLALAIGAAAGLVVVNPGAASASAYGCTPTTSVRIQGLSPANWCGGPNGSGRRVDSVNASFASSLAGVGYFCNTSMKVEVFNDRGQSVYTAYTSTRGGCGQAGGVFTLGVGRTFSSDGRVETTLLSYGAPKATLSHNIHG